MSSVTAINSVNPLIGDYKWTGSFDTTTITYSFPSDFAWWDPNYIDTEPDTAVGIDVTQQISFQKALQSWADVANISFVNVEENSDSVGDIRVAFSDDVSYDGAYAWAYMPEAPVEPFVGDIWLNPDQIDSAFSVGTDDYETLVHELGHALGLNHSFDDESEASTVGTKDTYKYTVMSYTEHPGAGYYTGGSDVVGVAPSTPMLLDIQAIQSMYGANMNTLAGNTIYTFSNTDPEFRTIWDAGGIDTFDLSNQTYNEIINLQAGQFSSVGKTYNQYEEPKASRENIAIAYNVTIENAIGGSGKDTILGNAGANSLFGGGNNDTIKGLEGNDVLVGNAGNDQLTGAAGNDVFRLSDASKDTITDFQKGIDVIQLENDVFTRLTATGTLSSVNFRAGAAADSDDYIIYNQFTGALYYDANGNGAGGAVQIGLIGTMVHPELLNTNLVVV